MINVNNGHSDPHPRFACGNRCVVFTARMHGDADGALVPTAALVRATA